MQVNAICTRYDADRAIGQVPVWKKGDVREIKAETPTFCCTDMAQAWDDNVIGFGESEKHLNEDANVNLYKCNPWPEGVSYSETAIRFCPFCAEKIEVTIKEANHAEHAINHTG